jgi:heme-degrading monooxygenase HmoA
MDSVEGSDGISIVVAYWKGEESIRKWNHHLEHLEAQKEGRRRWFKAIKSEWEKWKERTALISNS